MEIFKCSLPVNGSDEKDVPWVARQGRPGSYSVSQDVLDKPWTYRVVIVSWVETPFDNHHKEEVQRYKKLTVAESLQCSTLNELVHLLCMMPHIAFRSSLDIMI